MQIEAPNFYYEKIEVSLGNFLWLKFEYRKKLRRLENSKFFSIKKVEVSLGHFSWIKF
jgi:hypothetical protein